MFPGRRGQYEIISETKDYLLVRYVSGEWEGKEVKMSRDLHDRLQENIRLDRRTAETVEREEEDLSLDTWYRKYPALYNSLWYENITSAVLLSKLEDEYPEAADNVREELSE